MLIIPALWNLVPSSLPRQLHPCAHTHIQTQGQTHIHIIKNKTKPFLKKTFFLWVKIFYYDLGTQLSWQSICLIQKKPCVPSLAQYKPGMVQCTCIPSTRDMKAGKAQVPGHSPWLHNKPKSSKNYVRPCCNQNNVLLKKKINRKLMIAKENQKKLTLSDYTYRIKDGSLALSQNQSST